MRFIAKTLYGLEGILAEELGELGAEGITEANRAVIFHGDTRMMYAVNYMSRFAVSVLLQIAEFEIYSADDLYSRGMKIRWDEYFGPQDTFQIKPVVKSAFFNHTGFAALRLKDSIADFFRKQYGTRPSVDTNNPGIIINLHISNRHVTISVDSSGEPLFKRGYRTGTLEAPLNEVLAAGLVRLSGWDGKSSLIDPMCGSGTIAIEAALMASRTPPGKMRTSFGFQKWKGYDEKLFGSIKARYDSGIISPACAIFGFDISGRAVALTRANARNAGLDDLINVDRCDFRDLKPPVSSGYLLMNPPYGERLQKIETDSLYTAIGSVFKHSFPGFTACILSSDKDAGRYIGLKPAKKLKLYNGSLECICLIYELYEGSRKNSMSSQINT